ncbi:MAG: ComEA family DNA-binding protein [Terriglobales bacterium]
MRVATWIALLAGLVLLAACQQPYRVFAVQVASADQSPPGALADARPLPPALAGSPSAIVPVAAAARAEHPKWDLNRVPAQTLMGLPGMTTDIAAAIINGRPYRAKRELIKRKILTAGQYARWKDYLVVHRATSGGRAVGTVG